MHLVGRWLGTMAAIDVLGHIHACALSFDCLAESRQSRLHRLGSGNGRGIVGKELIVWWFVDIDGSVQIIHTRTCPSLPPVCPLTTVSCEAWLCEDVSFI